MWSTIKREWKEVLFQAVAIALVLVLTLILATEVAGNPQTAQLRYQKVIACEVAVTANPGKHPYVKLHECFADNGVDIPRSLTP